MVSRIDLTLLTIAGDPVAFKIAQMGIHCLGAHELSPPRAPRCGLSFTIRAFNATRRARVRTPLASRLHPFRPFNPAATFAPRPRALHLPLAFLVPAIWLGFPPARRTARLTCAVKLFGRWRTGRGLATRATPAPRSRTLPGRIRRLSSSPVMA